MQCFWLGSIRDTEGKFSWGQAFSHAILKVICFFLPMYFHENLQISLV